MNAKMPYRLIWESQSTIWCRFSGRVDFAEVNKASNEFFNDLRSDQIRAALWDFTAMTNFVIDQNEASEIAATDTAASGYMKPLRAAFVTQDSDFASLVEHYIRDMDQLGSHWTNRLFGTIDEARSWVTTDPQ